MARRKAPAIPDELLDQLLAGRDPGSALSEGGILDELKRAFAERALNAEMDHHLARGTSATLQRLGVERRLAAAALRDLHAQRARGRVDLLGLVAVGVTAALGRARSPRSPRTRPPSVREVVACFATSVVLVGGER